MSRGIVMENGKRHAIVMMPDGQFRKVPTKNQPMVGEEITFSERSRLNKPRKLYSIGFGAAAVILLLFIPFIMKSSPSESSVVAYVTIDVNPSIELAVNKDEKVEELRAMNADGAAVTIDLPYKGLPVEQVAEAIMDRIDAGHYIHDGEGDVVITSVLVHDGNASTYEINLKEHVDIAVRKALARMESGIKPGVEVTTLSAPKELRDEANRDGVSSGKLAFYLLAKSEGYPVSIAELKTQSLHQTAKAWGGVKAVIQGPKEGDSDSDKLKQEQKQKETLKELLKQEKQKKNAEKNNGDSNKGKQESSKPAKLPLGQVQIQQAIDKADSSKDSLTDKWKSERYKRHHKQWEYWKKKEYSNNNNLRPNKQDHKPENRNTDDEQGNKGNKRNQDKKDNKKNNETDKEIKKNQKADDKNKKSELRVEEKKKNSSHSPSTGVSNHSKHQDSKKKKEHKKDGKRRHSKDKNH